MKLFISSLLFAAAAVALPRTRQIRAHTSGGLGNHGTTLGPDHNRVSAVAAAALRCVHGAGSCSFPHAEMNRLRNVMQPPGSGRRGGQTAGSLLHSTSAALQKGHASTFAIVSLCYAPTKVSAYAEICETARKNFKDYSDRHGYRLFFHDHEKDSWKTEGRGPKWHKIRAVEEALQTEGIEYVFWMDADSLFLNASISLNSVLPSSGKQMTIAGDHNVFFNSGHFVLRNGQWAKDFLKDTWDVFPPPTPWADNSAMIYLMTGKNKACRESLSGPCCSADAQKLPEVESVGQRRMNSYVAIYQPGDWILHFAGWGVEDKARLMKEYSVEDKALLMKEYAQKASSGSPDSLTEFHAALLQVVWAHSARAPLPVCGVDAASCSFA